MKYDVSLKITARETFLYVSYDDHKQQKKLSKQIQKCMSRVLRPDTIGLKQCGYRLTISGIIDFEQHSIGDVGAVMLDVEYLLMDKLK